jgi:hypothetical protein
MSIMGWRFAVFGFQLAVVRSRGNVSGFAPPDSGLLAKLNLYAPGEAWKSRLQPPTANR